MNCRWTAGELSPARGGVRHDDTAPDGPVSEVTVVLDGRSTTVTVPPGGLVRVTVTKLPGP